MMDLESLPPLCLDTPTAPQERLLFKSVLEYAVLMSVGMKDKASFQRNISSLRPYYTLCGYDLQSKDSVTSVVLGLNLLYLLVENRLADFHCEVSFGSTKYD